MTRDGFPTERADKAARAIAHENADMRKAEAVRRQLSHVSARRKRGDKLVSIWMTADTFALWQRLHAIHGGTQRTLATALQRMDPDSFT